MNVPAVTPLFASAIVPDVVIVPPVSPFPAVMDVTVPPPVPGNAWPAAKVRMPVLAIEKPVLVGVHDGLLLLQN